MSLKIFYLLAPRRVIKRRLANLKEIDFRKIDLSIIGGFDYETSFGLIGGVAFSKGLIDVIKNKAMIFNWTFYYLTLGYNFGIFIQ